MIQSPSARRDPLCQQCRGGKCAPVAEKLLTLWAPDKFLFCFAQDVAEAQGPLLQRGISFQKMLEACVWAPAVAGIALQALIPQNSNTQSQVSSILSNFNLWKLLWFQFAKKGVSCNQM